MGFFCVCGGGFGEIKFSKILPTEFDIELHAKSEQMASLKEH